MDYEVIIKIPADKKDFILDALCFHREENSPIPKGAFAKEEIIKLIKGRVRDVEYKQIEETTRSQTESKDLEIDNILIT